MATVNEYKSFFLDRAPVGTVYMQLASQSLQVPLVGKGQKQTNKHQQGSQIKSVPSKSKSPFRAKLEPRLLNGAVS